MIWPRELDANLFGPRHASNRTRPSRLLNLQRSRNARFCDLCFKGLDTTRRVHNGSSLFTDSRLATRIVAQNCLFVGGRN
jgi:hypothetical protein